MLPGDFHDEGVVNNQDLTAIRNEWKDKQSGRRDTVFTLSLASIHSLPADLIRAANAFSTIDPPHQDIKLLRSVSASSAERLGVHPTAIDEATALG